MIAVEETALVLLAAGRGSRFGDAGKLGALLHGKPLGLHVADTLAALPFLTRIAVVAPGNLLGYASRGFEMIENPDRDTGMASSLRVGVAAARERGAAAVVVALADMPCVTAAHIRGLFDAAHGSHAVVASSDDARSKPPALFGSASFDTLLHFSGDQGARDLIARGHCVVASAAELTDVDTPEDLERLHALQ